MQRFVKFIAPRNKLDFLFKLVFFVVLCGAMNHTRAVLTFGVADAKTFAYNLKTATFTALPMSILALFLIQYLNTLQQCLYLQATTDQLTQLPNRRWFMDHLPAHLKRGHTLVLLDLDEFKGVNDTYGHDVGDDCLVAMAQHMRAVLPDGGRCARLGGEEFGILFVNTDLAAVQTTVKTICDGIDVPIDGHDSIRITASAGITQVGYDLETRRAFHTADIALYQAKSDGRKQYAMGLSRDLASPDPQKSGVRRAVG